MIYLDDFQAWCAYIMFNRVVCERVQHIIETTPAAAVEPVLSMALSMVSHHQRQLNESCAELYVPRQAVEHMAESLAYNINTLLQDAGLQDKPEVH